MFFCKGEDIVIEFIKICVLLSSYGLTQEPATSIPAESKKYSYTMYEMTEIKKDTSSNELITKLPTDWGRFVKKAK